MRRPKFKHGDIVTLRRSAPGQTFEVVRVDSRGRPPTYALAQVGNWDLLGYEPDMRLVRRRGRPFPIGARVRQLGTGREGWILEIEDNSMVRVHWADGSEQWNIRERSLRKIKAPLRGETLEAFLNG